MIQAYPSSNTKFRFELSNDLEAQEVIFFIGLNPSTADSNSFDPTSRSCHKLSHLWGTGAWSILNLYPQRAICPKSLHKKVNTKLFVENIAFVRQKLVKKNFKNKVVLSWGNAVFTRTYLKRAAVLFIDELVENQIDCFHMGLTARDQPIHPSPQAILRKYRSYSNVVFKSLQKEDLKQLKASFHV